jgi:hypothetical protein
MNPPGDIVPVIFFKILHELQLRNRRVHIVFFAETTVINTDRVEIACRECTGFVIKMSVESGIWIKSNRLGEVRFSQLDVLSVDWECTEQEEPAFFNGLTLGALLSIVDITEFAQSSEDTDKNGFEGRFY